MTSATAPAAEEPLEASWTDPKRYLWLLGLVVPLIPFIAWGLVEATGLGIMLVVRAGARLRRDPVPRRG